MEAWILTSAVNFESPLSAFYAFYCMLKALFVSEIFTFFSWHFGYVEKRLDKKVMVNFKIHDIREYSINNYSTHISQHLKK